ncbi:MAG: tetratricopeptide repeat protein [Methylococcaceae bacterium]|jgi:tetratricopeptide (TPR) repeat protein
MCVLKHLWEWFLDSNIREAILAVCTVLSVVIAGLWKLYKHFNKKEPSIQQSHSGTGDNGHPIEHCLTALPFIPSVFEGREADLLAIKQKLTANNEQHVLLLVNGQGGIGKTSIAAKYWQRYQGDYQHCAWIFVQASIQDALLSLALPLKLRFAEEWNKQQCLDCLLQALANLEQPCLLILDNVNDKQILEQGFVLLGRCPNFHILLTTRITHFEQAQSYAVGALPEQQAIAVFKTHYPKHQPADDALLLHIHRHVGGNTLVLELIAKTLQQRNVMTVSYGLANLLEDLKRQGVLSTLNSHNVNTHYQSDGIALRQDTPEAIITAMFDLAGLSEAELSLLSVFSVLPAENIRYAMLEILLTDFDNLAETVLALAQKGWLDHEAETDFKISPVLQEVIQTKHELRLLDDCTNLINGLVEQLDYESGTGHIINNDYQQAALYVRYAESVVKAIPSAEKGLAFLCERLGNFFKATGNLRQALGYFEEETELFKTLYEAYPNHVEFKNGLAVSYSKLGATHAALGNLDQALGYFEEGLKLSQDLYAAYPNHVEFKNGLAVSYSKLGERHTALGKLDQALGYFEEGLKLSQDLYAAYPNHVEFKNGLAISYSKLGETHVALGNLERALEDFEEDLKLSQDLYAVYPNHVEFKNGLAVSYSKLGATHTALGNLDQALGYFEAFYRLIQDLYAAYPNHVGFKNGLAISYSKLGATHMALGNLERALEDFEEDLKLCQELYAAYPNHVEFKNGLAVANSQLARLHKALNNAEKSLEYLKRCQQIWKELCTDSPNHAEFKNNLAWVESELYDITSNLENTAMESEKSLSKNNTNQRPLLKKLKQGLLKLIDRF